MPSKRKKDPDQPELPIEGNQSNAGKVKASQSSKDDKAKTNADANGDGAAHSKPEKTGIATVTARLTSWLRMSFCCSYSSFRAQQVRVPAPSSCRSRLP